MLYEPDNESEGSSKSTVTIQGEEFQTMDKDKAKRVQPPQGRPLLLRRGTAENATGSFKKRSLKLRRGTKEGKDTECEACEYIRIVAVRGLKSQGCFVISFFLFFFFYAKEDCMEIIVVDKVKYYEQIQIN